MPTGRGSIWSKGNMAFVSVVDWRRTQPPLSSVPRTRQILCAPFLSMRNTHGVRFVMASMCAGLSRRKWSRPLEFLHTSNPDREANYTYSRDFGAPFGLGMGLPLASCMRYHGGDLHVQQTAGSGGRLSGVHVDTFDLCTDARSRTMRACLLVCVDPRLDLFRARCSERGGMKCCVDNRGQRASALDCRVQRTQR